MRRWGQVTAVGLTALAVIAVAGCGGADEATTTTPATTSAGGPSSVGSAAQARMTKEAYDVVNTRPGVPICDPGGLSEAQQDEETCQWFWNHLLQWAPLANAESGPILTASTDSMIYEGFSGELSDTHYWGPDLPKGCEGTGDRKRNATYCKGRTPGLEFGKSTNIETYDNGSETRSTVAWKLSAGDVPFGIEYFTAYNNGGDGGDQWAFCGSRSSRKSGDGWVSCSRANAENDGATINTQQPQRGNYDFASFGWVVEDFPILVGVTNRIPSTTITLDRPDQGADVRFSETGSSPGALTGSAKLAGDRRNRASIWVAGFRKRVGDGKVDLSFTISVTKPPVTTTTPDPPATTPALESDLGGLNGASLEISVEFAQVGKTDGKPVPPTCQVKQAVGTGAAKCELSFFPGGVSSVGVLAATLLPKSGT